MFDWRELRRWGIPESRLPAGSVVRHRSPSLWQEHKLAVLGSIGALLLQSLLIGGLLYQRRRRPAGRRATANGTWRSRLTPAAVRRCRR